MGPQRDAYAPIENHGVIGDLHTVALVGMDGSIGYMCFPHFDSPTIFASLLDHSNGGFFQIAPVKEDVRRKQLYLPDTNVLFTRFLAKEGVGEVSDFMPIEGTEATATHNLVRRAKTVRGTMRFRMICRPKFNYGRAAHDVSVRDGEAIFTSRGPLGLVLRLRSSVPMEAKDGGVEAEFTLAANESASFVLEQVIEGRDSPSAAEHYVAEAFKDTVNYWHDWLRRSNYRGRWREMVDRSALALKLLTFKPTGAVVAAPTFGLPEEIGGVRNWDYRFTWIRDASFTLYGLMRLGYTEEARSFMNWVEARCHELEPDGSLKIMYGIDGRHDLKEETLDHLEGYRKSKPVRIGNGAHDQIQLDIYGELMDAVYLFNKHGAPISYDLWLQLTRLLEWVCKHWHEKDEGIWEVRGGRQEFLYSRLMCWVALDRGIRLAHKRSFPAPLDRWYSVRDTIYHEIHTSFWNPDLRAFVQYKGSSTLDAACLMMPLVRFIGPTDPRWLETLAAIERTLVDDSLVYRYKIGDAAHDGLAGEEGTFSICSFWFVECLARAGDLDKARFYFEKMLGYASHLGLYGEELGPRGEHLGNFPQAFTHLALISAAYDLDRRLSRTPEH